MYKPVTKKINLNKKETLHNFSFTFLRHTYKTKSYITVYSSATLAISAWIKMNCTCANEVCN